MNDHITDLGFDDTPVHYRAALMPELYPDAKPMRLENWSDEDLEMYCGGEYVKPAAGLPRIA